MATKAKKTPPKSKFIVLWSECGNDDQWVTMEPSTTFSTEGAARTDAEREANDGYGGRYAVAKIVAEAGVGKLTWD